MSKRLRLEIVDDDYLARTAGSGTIGSRESVVTVSEQAEVSSTTRLQTEDLYPDPQLRSTTLNTALRLLHESESRLSEALDAIRNEDRLGADDCMTHFMMVLPELFCCRELGDGFGLVVSSAFQGIQNLNGKAVSEPQVVALIFVMKFIRDQIFCSIDTAIDVCEKLTNAGFDLDPPIIGIVAEEIETQVLR